MKSARDCTSFFYGFDVDNTKKTIEGFIFREEIAELSHYSKQLVVSLQEIEQEVAENEGEIIYSAGDNILFYGQFANDWCLEKIESFKKKTGYSASMGIGKTVTEFYLALKIAKSKGGDQVIYYCEPTSIA